MRKFKKRFLMVLILVLMVGWNVGYGKQLEKVEKIESPKRIVYLKIVAEDSLTSRFGWMQFIEEIVETASEEFEKQLGIKLEIKKIERMKNVPTFQNLVTKLDNIDIDPEECDIVICLSYGFRIFCEGRVNKILGRYAFVMCKGDFDNYVDFKQTTVILMHEVAHLFGAKHVGNEFSVMYGGETRLWLFAFDDQSTKHILKHKWRNFRKE